MAIIDFSYPNLEGNEWSVRVLKELKDKRLFPSKVRFQNKEDAFKYYEHVRQMWQAQKQRGV